MPTTAPKTMKMAKLWMTLPPSRNRIMTTVKIVPLVMMVRDSVSLMAR